MCIRDSNIGGLRLLSVSARLNSCQIARKSQGFRHVIFLAIFIYCSWSKGGDSHVLDRFCVKNLPLLGAWISDWIGTAANRPSGGYSYQCVNLHGNQFLYLVSNALWLGSGISCREQYYIWCWFFVQWCDFQGQRNSAWNEYCGNAMVYSCHWHSCKYRDVCKDVYKRQL